MKKLVQEKEKAIALRKKGYTYKEILAEIPVAKSSLSLWLKGLPLTEVEKKHLRKRRDSNISLGRIRALSARKVRMQQERQDQYRKDKEEFDQYCTESLFHTGVSLYWAEGAKRSDMFMFSNSDRDMIEVMLQWLEQYMDRGRSGLGFRLYTHVPFAHLELEDWWAKQLQVSRAQFKKTVIKPSGVGIKKRPAYRGCLRIEVPQSGRLLLKVKHWTSCLIEYHTKE